MLCKQTEPQGRHAALQYVGNRYVQHNPNAADGPEGFKQFIAFYATSIRIRTARS